MKIEMTNCEMRNELREELLKIADRIEEIGNTIDTISTEVTEENDVNGFGYGDQPWLICHDAWRLSEETRNLV